MGAETRILTRSKTTSRIQQALKPEGDELKLITYAMGGFPDLRRSREIALSLMHAGSSVLELGIPFSDPLADGPVIQAAGKAALDAGASLENCLELAADLVKSGPVPIVFMTYANPVLAYGPDRFARDLDQIGVGGVIMPDLPIEEAALFQPSFENSEIDLIFQVTPTSSEERLARICSMSSGFVYCVTIAGVTGARSELPRDLATFLKRVRRHTDLPLAAGFGLSKPEHMRKLRGVADAAAVGSALVVEVAAGRDPSRLVRQLVLACQ